MKSNTFPELHGDIRPRCRDLGRTYGAWLRFEAWLSGVAIALGLVAIGALVAISMAA